MLRTDGWTDGWSGPKKRCQVVIQGLLTKISESTHAVRSILSSLTDIHFTLKIRMPVALL